MAKTGIDHMDIWRGSFDLRVAFNHNLASRRRIETFLLRAASSEAAEGYGQALPRDYLTGETVASCLDDIRARWLPRARDRQFDLAAGGTGLLAALADIYAEADRLRLTASYAAFETAVVDALARQAGIAGQRLWGDAPKAKPLVGVISATTPRKAGWIVRILRLFGYRRFKVKVGSDAEADAARLDAVRSAAGSGAWLAVDANAAWDAEEALRRLAGLKKFGIALVEEPLRPEAAATLGEIEKASGMPIMADESLCMRADAEKLLSQGTPSWWNLRVAKVGGFSGVAALARLAAENGVNLYGGVLVGETSCLAAAGRAAMGLADFACVEYGFPRFLVKNDPFRGGPGGFDGQARPLVGVGLGVRMLKKEVDSFEKLSF